MFQKIIIISGGSSIDPTFFHKRMKSKENGLIICCDGGARHFQNSAIKPDVIIGDMDSIDTDQLAEYSDEKIKIIKHPPEKDSSDTELALDYALNLRAERIFIWCALGGRIDHTLANVFLLIMAQKKKIETVLIDDYCEVFLLNRKNIFVNEKGKTVSFFALTSEVKGITLSGFFYPLKNGTLKMGESRGISNVISGARASIKIEKGKLLVVKYHRKDFFPKAQ